MNELARAGGHPSSPTRCSKAAGRHEPARRPSCSHGAPMIEAAPVSAITAALEAMMARPDSTPGSPAHLVSGARRRGAEDVITPS